MKKKKLLILSSQQFGYLTDTLKYCEYSSNEFEITYVGWDYNKAKVELPGITVKYVSRNASLIIRNLRLLYAFHKEINRGYDVIFANYSRGISLVKIFNKKSLFIVDIRTLSVTPGKFRRLIKDFFLKLEVSSFSNISVVSEGVAKKLKLKRYHILPLGGECFTSKPIFFDGLSCLYVGTLQDRNILDCVKGFHSYLKISGGRGSRSIFTIVGSSPGGEFNEIVKYVCDNKLFDKIFLTGQVHQNQLRPYFENANIGVSYVPKRPYFDYQPPTKTFEYLISGLPVIATSTIENVRIIDDKVGVLIDDNAESFCDGLIRMEKRMNNIDNGNIKKIYAQCRWSYLVKFKFLPLIKQLSL